MEEVSMCVCCIMKCICISVYCLQEHEWREKHKIWTDVRPVPTVPYVFCDQLASRDLRTTWLELPQKAIDCFPRVEIRATHSRLVLRDSVSDGRDGYARITLCYSPRYSPAVNWPRLLQVRLKTQDSPLLALLQNIYERILLIQQQCSSDRALWYKLYTSYQLNAQISLFM